jgi:hypothetical protein
LPEPADYAEPKEVLGMKVNVDQLMTQVGQAFFFPQVGREGALGLAVMLITFLQRFLGTQMHSMRTRKQRIGTPAHEVQQCKS